MPANAGFDRGNENGTAEWSGGLDHSGGRWFRISLQQVSFLGAARAGEVK
jgi:hypothetical protein